MSNENFKEDSLKKRYSFKIMANLTGIPLYLLMEAILPRALGPAAYGIFYYSLSIFQYLVNLFDAGTSTCLFTKLAKRPKEWGLIVFYCFFALLLFCLIGLIIAIFMLPRVCDLVMPGVPVWIIPLAGLLAYIIWLYRTLQGTNDALGQTIHSEKVKILGIFVAALFLLSLYFLNLLYLETLFLQQYFYNIIAIIAFSLLIKKNWSHKKNLSLSLNQSQLKSYSQEFIIYSSPIFFQALCVAFFLILERWLLQIISGSVEQGYFALGQRIGIACFLFVSAMTPLIMREFSKAHGQNNSDAMSLLVKRFTPIMYAIAVYFSAFIFVEAKTVISLFGGKDFMSAGLVIQIMALYPIHQSYGQVTNSIFYATAHTKTLSKITILSCCTGFILTYFLVAPRHLFGAELGAFGFSLKTVIMQIITVNIALVYCSKIIHINLKQCFAHQIICLGFFISIAFLTKTFLNTSLSLILPDLNFLNFKSLSLSQDMILFLLRGLVYTIVSGVIILFIPRLVGLKSGDIRDIKAILKKKMLKI